MECCAGDKRQRGEFIDGRIRARAGCVVSQFTPLQLFICGDTVPSLTPADSRNASRAQDGDSLDDLYPVLKCRVAPGAAQAFRAIAYRNGDKPGTHLRQLVETYLLCDAPVLPVLKGQPTQLPVGGAVGAFVEQGDAELERLEFRLPKFLKDAVKRRSEAEGMKSAQWVSALVQSSLMATPVLTDKEIEVVSWANRELAAVGRNFNQIARSMNAAELIGRNLTPDEQLTLEGLKQVDAKVRKLRDMLLRLVAARHRAWGVSDDTAS